MAYRRRQGITKASTFKEEIYYPPDQQLVPSRNSSFPSANNSLAAQAIRASTAARRDSNFPSDRPPYKAFNAYDDARNESSGFWAILSQKAKSLIDDDFVSQPRSGTSHAPTEGQAPQLQPFNEGYWKMDNPTLRNGLDRLTSSLNQIGDSFERTFEEGRTLVGNKKAEIFEETRRFQIRRKALGSEGEYRILGGNNPRQHHPQHAELQNQANYEAQQASRDVALATAAKAKLLLRELKTVKADLAFAKERCTQLEEENRRLREGRDKGNNAADDDLIRLQLETLLAEKARLAHENSIYARENRFLREIVEYHQLTMQDVVYIDEGIEEVTGVYPSITRTGSCSPPSPLSPALPSDNISPGNPIDPAEKDIYAVSDQLPPRDKEKGAEEERDAEGSSENLKSKKEEEKSTPESTA